MSVSACDPDWGREAPVRLWNPSRRLLRDVLPNPVAVGVPARILPAKT